MRVSRALALYALLLLPLVLWTGCAGDRGPDLLVPTGIEGGPGAIGGMLAAPAGYYDTVDATNAGTLRSSLHEIIDDHTRYPYTATSTDTWDILEAADEDPNDPGRVLDIYRNESYQKWGAGNTDYNREHSWPKSYGFPNDVSSNYPYTDCHHLFIANDSYNSSRSNKPYRNGDASWSEQVTIFYNGVGGGSGVYPGNSNWTTGSFTTGGWEVWGDRRGDVARALLYLDVRYEGGTHGVTGVDEPDLILTDNEALIAASNTGANETVGYMGMLTVLLQWHAQDPVDDKERARNDAVFSHQGNRNPFIDHPEWVDCIFNGTCGGGGGDTTPPAAPTGLVATGGSGLIDLDWADNTEGDLAGYSVYRADAAGGPYALITGSLLSLSQYADTGLTAGNTYYYRVTASDNAANESVVSVTASATVSGGGGGPDPGVAWINEFHYDNASTDTGEFVEVAGTAGTSLAGWSVVGYNGNGGTVYSTVSLSGTIDDEGSGYGALSFAFAAMQNGSPDGLALVNDTGTVVEFLSYEGALTAVDGPASGMSATDVGVAEATDTPVGYSLQRIGTGAVAADFSWAGPSADSPGSVNAGQSFSGGNPPDTTPPANPTALAAIAGEGVVDLDWADNGEADLDGYDVFRGTSSGGPYTQLNGTTLVSSAYTDNGVSNGTTYYYVVRAKDTTGNVSGDSNEVSASPDDTTAPAVPTGFSATAGDGSVGLDWANNGEADLDGYDVFRGTSSGGPYTQLNGTTLVSSAYTDNGVSNGTTYYYVVRAVDTTGNASAYSAEASATPQDTTPPAAPTGLVATAGDGVVDLDWADNGESDFAGYDVFRATSSGGPYTQLNGTLLGTSAYTDNGVSNGTTYYYVVRAEDAVGNVSANSVEVSASPQAPPVGGDPVAWINEFHYDDRGGDQNEFVEIAGTAGTDLTGWTIQGYNGNDGAVYATVALGGTIPDQQAGFGTVAVDFTGLQNGSPDGIALIDGAGNVIDFIAYEGSMTATSGPAAGMTATDIGVSEPTDGNKSNSLQKSGTGLEGADFGWVGPLRASPGQPNSGQIFAAPGNVAAKVPSSRQVR